MQAHRDVKRQDVGRQNSKFVRSPEALKVEPVSGITRVLETAIGTDDLFEKYHAASKDQLPDHRFAALLSAADWLSLSRPVRRRFAHKQNSDQATVYVGKVTQCFMTRAGWLLAQLCRVVGSPLPLKCEADLASAVTVTEDAQSGGQIWTRLYARRCGFPQIIHSRKCFQGPTGLEEHIGRGVGMTLRIGVEAATGALVFRSQQYFITLGRGRFYLPQILTPGNLTVRHTPVSERQFLFSLEIEHPRFGLLLRQTARFEETS